MGDAGFNGLSMLVGSAAFRVHDVDIIVQADWTGSEYGVEHVVSLCSTDDP